MSAISERLVDTVKGAEGFRELPYPDPVGRVTVGYGHRVIPLTEAEAEAVLRADLECARQAVLRLAADLAPDTPLSAVRGEVLTEMVFQLGPTGCRHFTGMWAALRDGDFQRAAVEMLDSQWARQCPSRVHRLATAMRLDHAGGPA